MSMLSALSYFFSFLPHSLGPACSPCDAAPPGSQFLCCCGAGQQELIVQSVALDAQLPTTLDARQVPAGPFDTAVIVGY